MSLPSWCLAVALLLCCLSQLSDAGNSPRIKPVPSTIDGVFRMSNRRRVARTFSRRSFNGSEEILDGYDMVVTPHQFRRLYEGGMTRSSRRIIATPWTDGIIPYKIINKGFNIEQVNWIKRAMKNWEDVTCVRFVPARRSDRNHIEIVSGTGCWAHLGMMGGRQTVNLDPKCFWKGTIEHELGHTIGLIHEHQRAERDAYIRVNYYGLGATSIGSLTKYARGVDDKMGLEYDYTSVMHYGRTAFAQDWVTQTIFTRDPAMEYVIGMIMGPSFLDAKLVNLMYKCQDKCRSPRRCSSDCFLTKNCQCFCPNDMTQENCQDKNPQCADKAKKGECRSDGFYMHTFCRRTCGICNDRGSLGYLHCVNGNDECQNFASSGECKKNPYFMHTTCAPACGDCEEGRTEAVVQGPCRDRKNDCGQRAANGECNSNPKVMLKECRQSCEFCQEQVGSDPSDKPGCVDFDTVCQYQAEFDMCRTLYGSLAVECAQHCGTCNVTLNLPDDCVDKKPECRHWAASGDCYRNSVYMQPNCPRACSLCSGIVVPDHIAKQCRDGNPKCAEWADGGECSRNEIWMAKYCRYSCGICGDKNAPDRCSNFNDQCEYWASVGECDNNPQYMEKNCAKSCVDECKGDGNGNGDNNNGNGNGGGNCVDENANCAVWASNDQCHVNPGYMNDKCKKSCKRC